ncbi:baseplate J/gp47 family protein [Clostridium sp. AN503]|uniref:baseplate assembly protein n=1 Tax=Clostridium sp. AN503 TaxID=3160598 RepID=UPI003458C0A5
MMAEALKKLHDFPDVSFIDNISFTEVQERMIKNFEKRYRELTGKDISLAPADPYRLILYACATELYQGFQYEDRAGKMGLLKYSTGDFLDNLAAVKGVTRNEAKPARTTMRFTLSAAISRDARIPAGIRVKGQDLYFETVQEARIPAGDLTAEVTAVCQLSGITGNGFLPGDIHTLVDPLPYTLSAENTSMTSGGADRESDESLAERVYLAPSGFSTAGPAASYEYWVKTYSSAIDECRVVSEAPGEVDIYVTVEGDFPTDSFMEGLETYLRDENIRPLTDKVVIKKPEKVEYEIEFVYYISRADRDVEETVQAAVQTACESYTEWQKTIGRDITPSRLIYELMRAGAQSVELVKPTYKELLAGQMAMAKTPVITYGGLRDG